MGIRTIDINGKLFNISNLMKSENGFQISINGTLNCLEVKKIGRKYVYLDIYTIVALPAFINDDKTVIIRYGTNDLDVYVTKNNETSIHPKKRLGEAYKQFDIEPKSLSKVDFRDDSIGSLKGLSYDSMFLERITIDDALKLFNCTKEELIKFQKQI